MKKGFSKNLISTSLVKASESNSTNKTGVFLAKKGLKIKGSRSSRVQDG